MGELRTTTTDPNEKVSGNKTAKKALLILLAISVLGNVATVIALNNRKEADNTSTTGNDAEQTKEAEFTVKHLLDKPFDINNDQDVAALIKAIEDATGTKIDDLLLKYYNYASLNKDNIITKEDFGNISDKAIADLVANYAISVYSAYSDGISDFANVKAFTMVGEDVSDFVKHMKTRKDDINRMSPFTMIDKNSYVYKTYRQDFDKMLDKELDDIINGNTSEYEKNAMEFFNLANKIIEDKNIDLGQKAVVFEGFKAIHPLFSGILDKLKPEGNATLKKEIENYSLNANYGKLLENFGIYVDIEIWANEKNEYEKRVAADQKKAEAIVKSSYSEKTTKKVEGETKKSNNHHTESSKVSQGTTAKPTTTKKTVEVPKEESKKAETPTKKSGGKVVEESSTRETTTIIQEEDIAPGEEYSDADEIAGAINFGSVYSLFRR